MKILVQNCLAFVNRSEAIAFAVADKVYHKAYRDFEGLPDSIYPCDKEENIFNCIDVFELDGVNIACFYVNGKRYWTSNFEFVKE